MSDHGFDEFMNRREAAARAYVSGDPAPLGEIVARESRASFFGPGGGHVEGTQEVWGRYEADAVAFGRDSENRLETIDQGAGPEIAYWAGFQRVVADFRG